MNTKKLTDIVTNLTIASSLVCCGILMYKSAENYTSPSTYKSSISYGQATGAGALAAIAGILAIGKYIKKEEDNYDSNNQ